jgi:protein-disulfide isomerase
MTDLGSAPLPALCDDDHVRGESGSPLVLVYADVECAVCALTHERLHGLPIRHAFRHFPIRSKHPRAWAAACAVEAAGEQGRFWELLDLLCADRGRLEDPHLWDHGRTLGLDVDRFDADRRSDAVSDRVRSDFQGGIRGGVATAPTLVVDGVLHPGVPAPELLERLAR